MSASPQKTLVPDPNIRQVRDTKDLVACPACGLQLPRDDFQGQIKHMESTHPEIIAERLKDLK